MKIKNGFITHNTDGEQLMVCVDGSFCGMVRSNAVAAKIIDFLKSETTLDALVDDMMELYDAPREVILADVNEVIEKLRSIDAIDE